MFNKRFFNEFNKTYKHKLTTDLDFSYNFLLTNNNNNNNNNNNKIVSVIIYDKLFLQFIVTDSYPFRPPEVFINDINDMRLMNYIRWCSNITSVINSRHFLLPKQILNAHMFSINNITKKEIPTLPINCICCDSILCINKWSPSQLFINIIDEAVYNKKLLFYTSKVGQKMINLIFNSLSDDIILHIFSFMKY